MSFSTSAARPLRRVLAATAVAALGLLAGCGGGTSQFEPFVAERLFAFGDENSHLAPDGRKFSVNGLTGPGGAIDCQINPMWVQLVAGLYGFSFAECPPPEPPTTFRALMRAQPGARVADVAAQVEAQATAGGFGQRDLALLMVGANDIVALYNQFPGRTESELVAEAEALGRTAAGVANRIIALGGRVIVANVPDMGLSPLAKAQEAAFPGSGRAALLSRLTSGFNDQLGVTVLLDGRFVGLVQTDLVSRAIARAPFFYGLVNASDGICTVALPNCTSETVVIVGEGDNASPAVASQYFWADATRLSAGAHLQIANLAADRARRNPF
jgi:lysophospholipase L1-like esterase